MGILRNLVGLLAALVCAGSVLGQGSGTGWKSPEGMVDAFLQIATRSDYSQRERTLKKWVEGIRYGVIHRGGEIALHDGLVDVHMRHVAQITGLDIRRTSRLEQANFLVVMTNDDHIAADTLAFGGSDADDQRDLAFRGSMCSASLRSDTKGAIRRAIAMIPVDRAHSAGQLVGCVAEELTHLMGLTNDTRTTLPSIFSHGTVHSVLGGLDTTMLKMLYDGRVKSGMKADALRPLLHVIAAEYQRAGVLDNAERLAGANGLAGLSP